MAYKFGRQQMGKPVPASIAFKVTIISIIAPILQTWLGTAWYIPNTVSNILISILALFIALSNALKPLFGVDVEAKTVPTADVKEVEDKPEENKP